MLSSNIKNFIKQCAKKQSPKEACGFLIKRGSKLSAVESVNISHTPLQSFIIDPAEVQKYHLKNIVAVWHSHIDGGQFSAGDVAVSEKLNKSFVLYNISTDSFHIYEPKGVPLPYVGRPFLMGTLDCFQLFKEYYARELNIHFLDNIDPPEYSNKIDWKKHEKTFSDTIASFLSRNGFQKVNKLNKHDIITTTIPSVKFPVHFMIYLGENTVLHHFEELSGIGPYNNALKRLTTGFYRHNNLL